MKKIRLVGERIVLRPLRKSDAKSFLEHVNDRELTRFLVFDPPISLKKELNWIKEMQEKWRKGIEYCFTIKGKESNELIGNCTLRVIDKKNGVGEIGLWIAKLHQGKGFGREAVKLLLNFGFKKLKLFRIEYYYFAGNKKSKKLIESLGAKFEGVLRKTFIKRGKRLDKFLYSFLRNEWKK
jgi:RimJ/RimL family protein N-acetyltransferase